MRKQTNQTATALPRRLRPRNFTPQCRFAFSTKLGTSPNRIVSGDTRFKEIVDVAGNEAPINQIMERVNPNDMGKVWAAFNAIAETKGSTTEFRLQRDGKVHWVETLGLAHGKGVGREREGACVIGTVADITEYKHAEEALRKSEERFKASILRSAVPTVSFDDRQQILAVSQSWLTAGGLLSAAEFQRMEDWTTRVYGQRSGEILRLIREIIATEPEARTDETVRSILSTRPLA
jgi:PAS domain-containing protein